MVLRLMGLGLGLGGGRSFDWVVWVVYGDILCIGLGRYRIWIWQKSNVYLSKLDQETAKTEERRRETKTLTCPTRYKVLW